MKNQELLEKIKKSSETVPIPQSLSPESIEKKLRAKKLFSYLKYTSAAAIFFFCMITARVWSVSQNTARHSQKDEPSAIVSTESTEASAANEKPERKDAGALYTVADSYDEVYRLLKDSSDTKNLGYAELEDASDSRAATQKSSSYSTTNLQTSGADEGDIIKTDGTCIYTLSDNKIFITDTSKDTLTRASLIELDFDGYDTVSEIYVSDGRLIIVAERYEISLEEEEVSSEEIDYIDGDNFIPLTDCAVNYSFSDICKTVLYIYDVSNPKQPRFTDSFEQEGNYQTSRIIDNIFYLFTEKNLADSDKLAKYESDNGSFLPLVNGKTISYDSIYLPEEGSQGLLISSLDLNHPSQIVDNVMIIHNFVNIYVATEALYLFHAKYENAEIKTDIAKFSLDNGIFYAVGAASVKGDIYDTFAIHDEQGKLRILTTDSDSSGEPSNNLYLFDDDLRQTGSLSKIAKGETIYAARFFNQTAYFITYRNTDPLFAVDLSDEHNPRLLGELEITGFSEYLHFWGEDKLLGIGYETDSETGAQKGIKLVMFDISNPANLEILDTEIINAYHSPALYNYKCVLADEAENILGFPVEYQTEDYSLHNNYLVYSWENNQFQQRLKETFDPDINSEDCRGIYINDTFYLADTKELIRFDRTNNYKKTESFLLQEDHETK